MVEFKQPAMRPEPGDVFVERLATTFYPRRMFVVVGVHEGKMWIMWTEGSVIQCQDTIVGWDKL